MKRRGLVACTALVLIAHVGMIIGVSHGHASVPGQAAVAPARSVFSLVRAFEPQAPTAMPAAAGTPPPPSASRHVDAPPREARRSTSASAQGAPDPSMADAAGAAVYRPGTDLDVPARPRSSPDLAMLSGLPWSGLPLRMRLYIDSDGLVVDTQVLQSAESPDVTERVRQMFLATSFTAGMEGGRAVPCFKDIELNVGAS
jgi:hypothetical protein